MAHGLCVPKTRCKPSPKVPDEPSVSKTLLGGFPLTRAYKTTGVISGVRVYGDLRHQCPHMQV